MRPEDDSTYVTTLFELTGFEFLSSKVDVRNVRNVSWTSEMSVGRQKKCQKCQLDVRNVRNVTSDQTIRSDQTVEKRTVL